MSDKVREQFEDSVRDRGFSRVITPGGFYENRMVQEWWETWQASRAAALEEVVRVCERVRRSHTGPGAQSAIAVEGARRAAASARECVDAIRALAAQDGGA